MSRPGTGLRIVRLANFVSPTSGGLRTALRCLGEGYAAAGHDPVLVVPGPAASDLTTAQGRVVTLPGPVVPGTGGYRVLTGWRRLARLLGSLDPDVLEVSDRTTLRWTGRWAAARGVPSVMVSHESLAGLLRLWRMPRADRAADRLNAATAAAFDRVVATTGWAAAEFRRLGVRNLVEVPLGVDTELFHPARYDPAVRDRWAGPGQVLVVHCSRLSPEKRPELAIDALAALRRDGVPAVLVVVGDGPRQAALATRAHGLPVHFTGFLPERSAVAALLASADVVIAPGPVETFGLAALEALASGTPVVVNAASALPEVVGAAGVAVPGAGGAYAAGREAVAAGGDPVAVGGDPVAVGGEAFAAGVRELLAIPEHQRRAAARTRATQFSWAAAVDGFLRVHLDLCHGPRPVVGAR